MGGCKSSAKWKEMGLWHEGEEPTEAELSLAYETLRQHDHKVDYILTHKYVDYTQTEGLLPLTLEGLTKYIDTHVTFTHWYAGHRHVAQCIDQRHTLVYDELVKIF